MNAKIGTAGRPDAEPEGVSAESALPLIPAQRQALILEFVRGRGAVSIHEIAAQLGASPSTVRRDLQDLTDRGYLERTRGGATLRERPRTMFEPSREIASYIAHPAKAAIGRHAAGLIEDGQSVIFDSSSTVLEAARAAARRDVSFTGVTNDIAVAGVLAESPNAGVIVVGGTLRRGSLTLTGEPGKEFLGRLSVDVAFIGAHSFAGMVASETSLEVAAVKKAFIRAAKRVVLLVDSSKFDAPAFCEVCHAAAFDEMITDDGLPDALRRQVEEQGVAVSLVAAGAGA